MPVTGEVLSIPGSSIISRVQHRNCLTERRCKVDCSEWSYSHFIRAEILLFKKKTTEWCKTIIPAAGKGRDRGTLSVLLPQKSLTQIYSISWE